MGRPSLDANVIPARQESAQEQTQEQPQQSQPLMPPPPPTPEGLERLYQSAKAMEARRQQKAREILAQQCTFKPQLIAAPRRMSLGVDASSCVSPLSPVMVEERFERLYLDAQTREAKRANAVKQLQEEVQRAGRPAITPRGQQIKGTKKGSDRLYEEARKMGERKAKLREEALAKECTFKPVTGRAPSNPRLRAAQAGTSFAERAMEYQAKVEAKVLNLKKEKEDQEAAKLTFKPAINAKAKAAAGHRSRGAGESVFDYLSRPSMPVTLPQEPTPDPDCTFKPSLPKRSSSAPRRPPSPASPVVSRSPAVGPPMSPSGPTEPRRSSTPIFQRLYDERTLKEEKLRVLKAASSSEVAKDCTFTPRTSLNNTPTQARRSNSAQRPRTPRSTPEVGFGGGERDGSVTPQSVFSRLYDEFKAQEQRTQSRRDEQMQDMLRQCPFSPQLNKAPHPSRLSLGNKENAWEEALAAQSSSQPKTPDSTKPRQRSAIFERLALEVEMRKQKEADRLAQKEQHDLEGCTFSPLINPPSATKAPPPPSSPLPMPHPPSASKPSLPIRALPLPSSPSPVKPMHPMAALGNQDMNVRPEEEEGEEEVGKGNEVSGHVENEALTN